MRIGYLYDLQAYPPRGGNHRHVLELVQGFLAAGHSVLVVDDPTMPGVKNFDVTTSGIQLFSREIDVLYVGFVSGCMQCGRGPESFLRSVSVIDEASPSA